jgi:hypothetical protein
MTNFGQSFAHRIGAYFEKISGTRLSASGTENRRGDR